MQNVLQLKKMEKQKVLHLQDDLVDMGLHMVMRADLDLERMVEKSFFNHIKTMSNGCI